MNFLPRESRLPSLLAIAVLLASASPGSYAQTGTGTGSGSGTDFGRGTGTTGDTQGTGTGTGASQTGTGNGTTSGSGGGTSSGTGDGNVYKQAYGTGTGDLRSGNYQDAIDQLRQAQGLASQYGSAQEQATIQANLASAYLWRGIEIYKDAAWAQDYDNAISYLNSAQIQISQDDFWVSAMGGMSQAMRKLNLKNYYLGMCYFEKGAYFDWVDNDGLAKMYLSMVTKSRDQWSYFSDPRVLLEQKTLYADAKYTLAQLQQKSGDTQYAAQNYMEAYRAYKELKATGMGELVYYFGEGDAGMSYNQLYFSNRRKPRQTMDEKMQTMEAGLINLSNQAIASSDYGSARGYANYVFQNSQNHDSKSSALDAVISSYEKSNDFQRAIQLRQQYRNDYGYHRMTLGMAGDYRQMGDNATAKSLYIEVVNSSGADRSYKTQAADGLAELTLPDIDSKISGGNLPGAVSSIKSFLDTYPTSRKNDFTRRIADVIDKYTASGQNDAALKLIDDFTSHYSSDNDSLLDGKKIGILEKSGNFDSYKSAVLAFDAKYHGSSPDTADAQLVHLVQVWEQRSSKDPAAIQELVDRLAQRGNSFGTQRHAQAASAELARVKGLGNKAAIRAGLLHMAVFPDSNYSTAKAIIASARELYLAQYASPWYYDAKSRSDNSPESAKGFFGGFKDEKGHQKHVLNADLFAKISDRELTTYARYDANELDRLLGPATDALTAYRAVTSRIDKELVAFNAWKDAGFFKKGGAKKAYEALHAQNPTLDALENAFLAKAYSPRSGTGGGTLRQGAPSFDGANSSN